MFHIISYRYLGYNLPVHTKHSATQYVQNDIFLLGGKRVTPWRLLSVLLSNAKTMTNILYSLNSECGLRSLYVL